MSLNNCQKISTVLWFVTILFVGVISRAVSATHENSTEWIYDYEVVAEYRHDVESFTQGLFFDHGVLYEGSGRLGQSSLRRQTIEGRILQKKMLPSHYYGEGITGIGDRIFQLTWKSGTALVWDKETMTHTDTHHYTTQGWGLTNDGRNLIMSDGSSTLYFRNSETFDVTKTITVQSVGGPVGMLNELEYIDQEIWANIWKDDWIVRIDPESGRVTGWLDLSELASPYTKAGREHVLNGIAYDHDTKRIFVTGKYWPKLFEIRVTGRTLFSPPPQQ